MFDAIDYVDLRPQAKSSLLEFKKMIIETKEAFDGMEDLYQIMPVLMKKNRIYGNA